MEDTSKENHLYDYGAKEKDNKADHFIYRCLGCGSYVHIPKKKVEGYNPLFVECPYCKTGNKFYTKPQEDFRIVE